MSTELEIGQEAFRRSRGGGGEGLDLRVGPGLEA